MEPTSSTDPTPAAASRPRRGGVFVTKVQVWVALVFMTAAFAAGFAVRGMQSSPVRGHVPVDVGDGSGSATDAPALSDAQLKGGLPEGHPAIDSSGDVVGDVTTTTHPPVTTTTTAP